jgi:LAO/AO transport system ATPase
MRDSVFDRFATGDRLALSRLLSQAARGDNLSEIAAHIAPPEDPGRIVAITGSGGTGKSTLIGKLIDQARCQGLKVAVLACDPQSPLSGGALLGDRFRMPSRPDDDGVFIRSLAALSGSGAVADHLSLMIRLCQAFGFDVVFIETVGAGQGDIAVRDLADLVVLLVQPETGDDLQWEKAGVLEVADIVVIHKADLPGAAQAAAQIRAAVELSERQIPVLSVSSKTGEGVAELWQALRTLSPAHTNTRSSRELLRLAQQVLADRFAAAESMAAPALTRLVEDFGRGLVAPDEAARQLLKLLHKEPKPADLPAR